MSSITDCDWPTMNHSVDCYSGGSALGINFLFILVPLVIIGIIILLIPVDGEK